MKRISHLGLFGCLVSALGTVLILPDVWLRLTGTNKDYDLGGLIFVGCFFPVATVGFVVATVRTRRKERIVEAELRAMGALSTTKSARDDAFVRFDFVCTYAHTVWVSTVSYDRGSPDGFRYKMFAVRREPEMTIELVLLLEAADGLKRQVFRVEAQIEKLDGADQMLKGLEQDMNVEFQRFDSSGVRSQDELRARAIEVGCDICHSE